MEQEIFAFFDSRLKEMKEPDKAVEMGKYMKEVQPFLGVQRPERDEIYKEFKRKYGSYCRKEMKQSEYVNLIDLVWNGGFREHRYAAMFLIEYCKKFLVLENLNLFKRLIEEGAWWDTTDMLAQKAVGQILAENFEVRDEMMLWAKDEDLWVRRSSILSQNRLKGDTDTELLGYVIRELWSEDEFFIQKAIGWALREYSKSNRDWVTNFIAENEDSLSKLAVREGSKYI